MHSGTYHALVEPKQLEIPLTNSGLLPCSFAEDAYQAAQTIIGFRGEDALIYIALRQFDDFQDDIDQAYWVEVRRACKFILGYHHYWECGYLRLPMR